LLSGRREISALVGLLRETGAGTSDATCSVLTTGERTPVI